MKSVRTNWQPSYLRSLPLTSLEFKCLENICCNEFNDGNGHCPDSYEFTHTWSNMVGDGGKNNLKDNQISALMSNLCRKGYVITNGESCRCTPLGFALYRWTQS